MLAGIIEEIASLWKLGFAICFFVGLVLAATVFRRQIRDLLEKAKIHVKRGETEVSLDRSIEPRLPERTLQEQEVSPAREEKKGKVSATESTTETDWEVEMWVRFNDQDLKAVKEAYEKLQNAEGDPEKKLEHELWYQWMRYRKGDADAQRAIQQLEERLADHPKTLNLLRRLDASCYDFSENHLAAAERYKDAAQSSQSEVERARNIGSAAGSLADAGRVAEAHSLPRDTLKTITEPDAQAELYLALAERYAAEGRKEERAIMLEKALVGRPNSVRIHFDAGYAYGEADIRPLSVSHYNKTLGINPKHASALNNIGVAFADLGANKLAVDYYKRAITVGETLASANLAYILMDAGAWEEAAKVLKEAQAAEDIHPNVNNALVKLRAIETENEDRRTAISKLAAEFREFALNYADAMVSGNLQFTPAGEWECANAKAIEIRKLSGNRIEIRWTDRLETRSIVLREKCRGGAESGKSPKSKVILSERF